jgi:hypothetical protein
MQKEQPVLLNVLMHGPNAIKCRIYKMEITV